MRLWRFAGGDGAYVSVRKSILAVLGVFCDSSSVDVLR